jgi:transposase
VQSFPSIAATAITPALALALALTVTLALSAPRSAAAADLPDAAPATGRATTSAAWRALQAEPPTAWTFLRADGTVHQALQRWTREAGWQLVWEVERDFPIDADVTLRGDFLDALNQAMAVLRDTDFPLQARVQAETRVVRIVRYLPDGARQ